MLEGRLAFVLENIYEFIICKQWNIDFLARDLTIWYNCTRGLFSYPHIWRGTQEAEGTGFEYQQAGNSRAGVQIPLSPPYKP